MVHTEETGSGLSERTSRYRVRQISSRTPGNHGGVLSLTRPITGRTVVDAADIVPSLTTLALDAIVANFENNPDVRRVPPEFLPELVQRLPTILDPRLVLPYIHDEEYYNRVCKDPRIGWGQVDIREHGCSWKQAFAEKYVAKLIETFGTNSGVAPEWDERFCRPPIDSTHPEWRSLHPGAPLYRMDRYQVNPPPPPPAPKKEKKAVGREEEKAAPPPLPWVQVPNKERYSSGALDPLDIDAKIITGGDSGWPYLEKLKILCQANSKNPLFSATQLPWNSLDKALHLQRIEEHDAKEAETQEKADKKRKEQLVEAADANQPKGKDKKDDKKNGRGATSSASGRAGKKGEEEEVIPTPLAVDPSYLLPPTLKVQYNATQMALKRQREEDKFDLAVEKTESGIGPLREWVSPIEEEAWSQTTIWPEKRKESVIALRARELQTFLDRIAAAEDDVFRLHVEDVPSRVDFELIFTRLPNLTSLSLTYKSWDRIMAPLAGTFKVPSDDKAPNNHASFLGPPLGATIRILPADVTSLSRCLKFTDTLTELCLPSNGLTDDLLELLLPGLAENNTLTHLDLSHNALTGIGIRRLAKVLSSGSSSGGESSSVLISLDLTDNEVDETAGEALGAYVASSYSLLSLSMRLNPLGDVGCARLLEGVAKSRTLTHLNLASTGASQQTMAALCQAVREPDCALEVVSLSGNAHPEHYVIEDKEMTNFLAARRESAFVKRGPLGSLVEEEKEGIRPEDLEALVTALKESCNQKIVSVDIRPLDNAELAEICADNEIRSRGGVYGPMTGKYMRTLNQ